MSKSESTKQIEAAITLLVFLIGGGWIYFKFFANHQPDLTKMPAEEAQFVTIISDARAKWNTAPNDISQQSMPEARNQAICGGKNNLAASNWVGKIQDIEVNSMPDKNGKIAAGIWISVTPQITLVNPHSSVFDDPQLMIEQGSPLYQTASTLSAGEAIVFSGNFIPRTPYCIEEDSLTNEGGMTTPVFDFEITKLTTQPN